MTKKTTGLILMALAVSLSAGAWAMWRGRRPIVDGAQAVSRPPEIRPDYSGVTIPANIAPLNFSVCEQGTQFFVRVGAETGDPVEVFSRSPKIRMPAGAWRALLSANRGKELWWDVCARQGDRWQQYQRVFSHIADEDIDSHLVYRLIDPVYSKWREITVRQRDLTTYQQSTVLSGMSFNGGCVNCHSFPNNDPNRMLIGIRSGTFGSAALLAGDGKVTKIGTRFGYTAWHPSGRLAVYSMNKVRQFFHTAGAEVRDVVDLDSALAYYTIDLENSKLVPGASDKQRLETYPTWSPDGRFLYFCSAPLLWPSDTEIPPSGYDDVKYDLMRIPYETDTDRWGDPELVLSAEETGLSILLPRISPDGRFLLFCMCSYGCFPVYQPTSDLYLMDLDTQDYSRLEVNSEFSESWHSWSSNGRWIAFSSKRCGGLFTRCYFSYIDRSGKVHKPFVLPQSDPDFYKSLLKTISVPELVTGPVPFTEQTLARAIRSDSALSVDALSGATEPQDPSKPWQPTME